MNGNTEVISTPVPRVAFHSAGVLQTNTVRVVNTHGCICKALKIACSASLLPLPGTSSPSVLAFLWNGCDGSNPVPRPSSPALRPPASPSAHPVSGSRFLSARSSPSPFLYSCPQQRCDGCRWHPRQRWHLSEVRKVPQSSHSPSHL